MKQFTIFLFSLVMLSAAKHLSAQSPDNPKVKRVDFKATSTPATNGQARLYFETDSFKARLPNGTIFVFGGGDSIADYCPWDTTSTAIIQKDATLNVGIGTPTPVSKLHVFSINNTYVLASSVDSSCGYAMYTKGENAAISLMENDTSLSFTGAVGDVVDMSIAPNGVVTVSNLGGNGDSAVVLSSNTGVLSSATLSSISPWTSDSSTIYQNDTTKKVGIGTATPLQQFHVLGDSYFNGSVGIGISNPVPNLLQVFTDGGANFSVNTSEIIGTSQASQFTNVTLGLTVGEFYVDAMQNSNPHIALHIDTFGNVGIGTAIPTEKLHVNGNTLISDTLFTTSFSLVDSIAPDAGAGTILNLPTGITGDPDKYFVIIDDNGDRFAVPGFLIP